MNLEYPHVDLNKYYRKKLDPILLNIRINNPELYVELTFLIEKEFGPMVFSFLYYPKWADNILRTIAVNIPEITTYNGLAFERHYNFRIFNRVYLKMKDQI